MIGIAFTKMFAIVHDYFQELVIVHEQTLSHHVIARMNVLYKLDVVTPGRSAFAMVTVDTVVSILVSTCTSMLIHDCPVHSNIR